MTKTIRAADFVKPEAPVVGTAEQIAGSVVRALTAGDEVVLDVRDIRGAPTSFFNVILLRVRDAVGVERMERDLRFELGSPSQRLVFERSLAAVRAGV